VIAPTRTTDTKNSSKTGTQTYSEPVNGLVDSPNPSVHSDAVTRVVPRGKRRAPISGEGRTASVMRAGEAPKGFDVAAAKKAFVDRARGSSGKGKTGAGGMMDSFDDDGSVDGPDGDDAHDSHDDDSHDGHHDDDYDDGYHDGYHDGHHDDDDIDIHIDINIYTDDNCPNGWWYLYGDYNGDGYTDYVCTNGYNSHYWYGWSGFYWGASPWYGYYGYSHSWWYYSVPDRYRGVVYGIDDDFVSDPSYGAEPVVEAPMPDAVPLPAIEVARLEMSFRNVEVAIDAYKAHLDSYPTDWLAVRELGLALVQRGDRGDGIALVNYAYSMDPSLAYDAVPISVFGQSDRVLRDSVVDVVGWGHRNPSASAWLTVAVLMQAEGRDGPALRMIDRAQEFGLDAEVESTMRSVLIHY